VRLRDVESGRDLLLVGRLGANGEAAAPVAVAWDPGGMSTYVKGRDPDGRRLYFTIDARESDVWVMAIERGR